VKKDFWIGSTFAIHHFVLDSNNSNRRWPMAALQNNRISLRMDIDQTLEYSVLLLSFDFLMTELLCDVMAESKIDARHAWSPAEAGDHVAIRRPHLILVDWDVDGEDTIAIHRQLRRAMRLNDVPAILMTDANVSQGLRSALSLEGVRWILEKPIVPTSLPKLIKSTITEADMNAHKNSGGFRLAPRIHAGESASGAMWQKI
jgi:DNA-binding response OmpR family regulator